MLREINLLHSLSITSQYFSYDINFLYLDGIGSRRIWDLLAEARSCGMEIVQSGRAQRPVAVVDGRTEVVLRPDGSDGDLLIEPVVTVDGHPVGAVEFAFLGDPVHGVAYWPRGEDINRAGLTLAPIGKPIPPSCGSS